jgi:hypothetical protein
MRKLPLVFVKKKT